MHRFLFVCFFLVLSLSPAENLLGNGGFEDEFVISKSAPKLWAMWGPEQFKLAENYSRVLDHPYQGRACFRIHHPAQSRGYIITFPTDNALKPKKGMVYTIRFWARADKPGLSSFWVGSYKTINPHFVDGPSLGRYNLSLTTEWKPFSYTFTEGLDFFSEAAPFIYLGFNASLKFEEERTLWLDEVFATEAAGNAATVGMVDDSALPYAPLPLRLQPGEKLSIKIQADRRLRRVNRLAGGVSFHQLAGWTGLPFTKEGSNAMSPALWVELQDLKLPLSRAYGLGDEGFSLEEAIDKYAEALRLGGIPQETSVLEFENHHANSVLTPEVWARGVRYAAAKGYRFQYWEIGNETFSSIFAGGKNGKAFPTPEDYVKHFNAVSAAIRRAQPAAKLGLSVDPRDVRWGNFVMKATAGNYDFICPHYYGFPNPYEFEETVLAQNHALLNRALQINALLKLYNPGREVFTYDTEWGLHASMKTGGMADGQWRNANIVGTLYRAVRLLYYAREDVVRAASSWQLLSITNAPGFGVIFHQAPEQRSMLYWLYYFYNRSLGDWVIDLSGTAPTYKSLKTSATSPVIADSGFPATPAMASVSEDGQNLYLMLVNGSWSQAAPCDISISSFPIATAEGVILSHDDPEAHPLLRSKEEFVNPLTIQRSDTTLRFTLPPHSVVFIKVR